MRNIECRNVEVRDGNGACVRLGGRSLNFKHIYVHSLQQGLLTGGKPGHVSICHSYLERLGHDGRAHGNYQAGGIVSITGNTLQQDSNSQNWDLIGFALEKGRHKENAPTVQRNVIIMERIGGNNLLHSKAKGVTPVVSDNIIVSPKETGFEDSNFEYRGRKEAKLPLYPEIPEPPL